MDTYECSGIMWSWLLTFSSQTKNLGRVKMAESNDHDKFFCMMDRIIDKALSFEPRMQVVEFRTSILWSILRAFLWGSGTILVGAITYFITSKIIN